MRPLVLGQGCEIIYPRVDKFGLSHEGFLGWFAEHIDRDSNLGRVWNKLKEVGNEGENR